MGNENNEENSTHGSSDNSLMNVKLETSSPPDQIKIQQVAERLVKVAMKSSSIYSGPIPPPEVLKAYDLVKPGLAGEIVDMAKEQSQHRMEMEKVVIVGDSKRSWAGLILGSIISFAFLASGTYLIIKGHDIAGATLVGANLAALVSTFVYGSQQREKERTKNREALLKSTNQDD